MMRIYEIFGLEKGMLKRFLVLLAGLALMIVAGQSQAFIIKDIQIEGLRRISAGTIFNYLPVEVGDELDTESSQKAMRALYETGFFHDIEFFEDDGVLIIKLVERPAIAGITLTGNDSLEEDAVLEGLKQIGLAEGRVYNRSLLDQIQLELRRQYYSTGHYDVHIEPTVTPLGRNRVDILIKISEGEVAKIKQINIVGNKSFDEHELMDDFTLGTAGTFSWFSSRDQYAREKLTADLEHLRSFYLDKGFLEFSIESTQVALSPDKQHVFLTVNISEGKQYRVSDVKLVGNTILPSDELIKEIFIKPGELFSQKLIEKSTKHLMTRLGDEGYAFANVAAYPGVDKEKETVEISFVMEPGNRVFVRRITFKGNDKTQDKVLRREMRQFEGGWYSSDKVEKSKIRLQRLGFFDSVEVETPPVPGTTDQVDVIVTVTERSSGNIQLTAGYAEDQGITFGASLQQDNFLGSGNKFGFTINTSEANQVYSLDYTNPYFTKDAVSLGYKFYFRETDNDELSLSDYTTDSYGASVEVGFPIKENERVYFGLGFEHLELEVTESTPQRILDYINDNGSAYDTVSLSMGWGRDSRNRHHFASSGSKQSIGVQVAVPGSDKTFYKMMYQYRQYFSLYEDVSWSLGGSLGWADSYGDTSTLPFYENYFAGGFSSVRGYQPNSLGPRDELDPEEPIGGNLRILGSTEIVYPMPLINSKAMRLVNFVDCGNVYNTHDESVDIDDIRFTAGVGLYWLSPIGSLKFSLAYPLNKREEDKTKAFQFSLGTAL